MFEKCKLLMVDPRWCKICEIVNRFVQQRQRHSFTAVLQPRFCNMAVANAVTVIACTH